MKKLILLPLLVCLTAHINAQEFHFIPKVGLNIASFTNSEELDSRTGLNIGFGAELALTPVFSLESGMFYSMQGMKGKLNHEKTEFFMDYLNIPVYAKCYAYEGLHFFGGPQFAFNVGSNVRYGNLEISDEVKEMIRKFDIGLGIGAGYQFDIGLVLSASYTYGLIGIANDKTPLNGEKNGHNSVLQFNVGWRF